MRLAAIAVLFCMMTMAGCWSGNSPDSVLASVNETNIQRLANLYFTYQSKHNWRGPKDEGDFKDFVRTFDADKLARIGIDPAKVDELFVSERDGQPFQIRYSVPGSAMGSSEPVVFEAVGVGGQRQVGFLNMEQREVDEAEFADLWAGKAKPATNGARTPWER